MEDDMFEGLLALIANTLYTNGIGDMRTYTPDDCVTIGQFLLGDGHTPDDYGMLGQSYLEQYAGDDLLADYIPAEAI